MKRWFFRRRDHDASLWPVRLLLMLVVLLPTAVLTWLVVRAAESERLLVRQRLAESHRATLQRMQRRFESDLAALLEHCDRIFRESGGEGLAAEVIQQRIADAVVCFDHEGRVTYPVPHSPAARDSLEAVEPWTEAMSLEFQQNDFRRAAERFGAIAALSEHPDVKARAWQAQARCLYKNGDAAAAIDALLQITQSPSLRAARDPQHRLIAADACLRALELMVENAYPAGDVAPIRERIAALIAPGQVEMAPSSQRRFVARRLRELFPQELEFPWLAAEELAADYALLTPPPAAGKLHATTIDGVWQIVSPQRRVVLLFRRSTLAGRIADADPLAEQASVRAVVLSPDDPDRSEEFLAMAHSPMMPGWRLALAAEGDALVESEAGRRITAYVWTTTLAIGAVAVSAALLLRTVGRRHRLQQLQNDWLATVSHELKTPLTSIHLLTDSLLEEENVDRAAYLRLISGEAARLTRLIERLLMLTRSDSTASLVTLQPVQPGDLLDSACEAIGERLAGPDCQFRQDLEPDLPPVLADRDAMTIVLVNLLENAYKFTGAKKEIELTAEREGEDVCFRVRDNGIGMPPAVARRVFDKFYQADRRLSRERGGCGLGLSIVKLLVEAQGGSATVESRPGVGSTFVIRLPALHDLPRSAELSEVAPR